MMLLVLAFVTIPGAANEATGSSIIEKFLVLFASPLATGALAISAIYMICWTEDEDTSGSAAIVISFGDDDFSATVNVASGVDIVDVYVTTEILMVGMIFLTAVLHRQGTSAWVAVASILLGMTMSKFAIQASFMYEDNLDEKHQNRYDGYALYSATCGVGLFALAVHCLLVRGGIAGTSERHWFRLIYALVATIAMCMGFASVTDIPDDKQEFYEDWFGMDLVGKLTAASGFGIFAGALCIIGHLIGDSLRTYCFGAATGMLFTMVATAAEFMCLPSIFSEDDTANDEGLSPHYGPTLMWIGATVMVMSFPAPVFETLKGTFGSLFAMVAVGCLGLSWFQCTPYVTYVWDNVGTETSTVLLDDDGSTANLSYTDSAEPLAMMGQIMLVGTLMLGAFRDEASRATRSGAIFLLFWLGMSLGQAVDYWANLSVSRTLNTEEADLMAAYMFGVVGCIFGCVAVARAGDWKKDSTPGKDMQQVN
eukprot:CAMPEP_0182484942 /NCGR_PEP_ID=MMETSP1319-20130603/44368_1 /TAXON_ID=172717 /ORGANISM="Bolidomonas pacifica, Strain RCC208" /LENGTH=480 /DNA_ID=CAMNT_0024686877 /DNA_START=1 /DNA_END=1441 /DNA_ORIENTATION=-